MQRTTTVRLRHMYRVFNLNDLQWMLEKEPDDAKAVLTDALAIADGDGMDLVGIVPASPPEWPETLFIFKDRPDAC
jgi:hypothetical protein